MKFFFTYGADSDKQVFKGGWSEVIAPDTHMAIELYRVVHPFTDTIPCAFVYDEKEFSKTLMWKNKDNFGHGCREVIELKYSFKDRNGEWRESI